MSVAIFDTKSYDREYLSRAADDLSLSFFAERLSARTAPLAHDCHAVCLFVNDLADRETLLALKEQGISTLTLRCAGFNNVDLDAARELGFTVTRVPAYSPHAVAEHTLALLLSLNRQIHRAYHRVRDHNFSLAGLVGFDLHGKTVGIIGCGKIGRITAEIFRGFGCHVTAYDPHLDQDWAAAHQIQPTPVDELLKKSDVISLHLPLTPDTHHLIDADALALMKKGSTLINTGRGKLISTKALIQALKSGHLRGVALDVYEEEEGVFFEDLSGEILHDDDLTRLLTFPNVLITSHQAFLTAEALTQIAQTTCENLRRLGNGQPPLEGTQL
ncbi:MAG: 2-hydroxyacid dehydrogenase [Verrucomicrobiaceae bacterium]